MCNSDFLLIGITFYCAERKFKGKKFALFLPFQEISFYMCYEGLQ